MRTLTTRKKQHCEREKERTSRSFNHNRGNEHKHCCLWESEIIHKNWPRWKVWFSSICCFWCCCCGFQDRSIFSHVCFKHVATFEYFFTSSALSHAVAAVYLAELSRKRNENEKKKYCCLVFSLRSSEAVRWVGNFSARSKKDFLFISTALCCLWEKRSESVIHKKVLYSMGCRKIIRSIY